MLFTVSCSKSTTHASTSPEGTWTGSFSLGGPSRNYALTFKSDFNILVESTDPTTPEIANGTWRRAVGDSIIATFTYVGGSAGTYSIAGYRPGNSNVMEGTIGPGYATTGAGTFIVSKE